MKRVLVTGASGFVGAWTLEPLLRKGYEVHAVSRRKPKSPPPGVVWHEGDLMDGAWRAALVAEVSASHLLHLAWYAEHGKFWASPENLKWVSASLGLFTDFANAGGRRWVGAGSCAEYEWGGAGPLGAGTPLSPASLYGVSKNALRQVLEKAARERGVSFGWGRIFFLFGPGEQEGRLVPSVITSLLGGREAACSEGRQRRDFLYVEDVAAAFVEFLDRAVEGSVDICSGTGTPVREVALMIGKLLNKEALVRLGAPNPAETEAVIGDAAPLRDKVKFTPADSLSSGLRKTIDFHKRAGAAGA